MKRLHLVELCDFCETPVHSRGCLVENEPDSFATKAMKAWPSGRDGGLEGCSWWLWATAKFDGDTYPPDTHIPWSKLE